MTLALLFNSSILITGFSIPEPPYAHRPSRAMIENKAIYLQVKNKTDFENNSVRTIEDGSTNTHSLKPISKSDSGLFSSIDSESAKDRD